MYILYFSLHYLFAGDATTSAIAEGQTDLARGLWKFIDLQRGNSINDNTSGPLIPNVGFREVQFIFAALYCRRILASQPYIR
jgi:hypothetical protein